MNMLVTGGAGFIGSHLCEELVNRGHNVWCLDNLYLGTRENIESLRPLKNFCFCKFDILEKYPLEKLFSEVKFDRVFHLAANSDIRKGAEDRLLDLRFNFLSTFQILGVMRKYEVKNIFFASTSAVFGKTAAAIDENYGPLQPLSFYGASKLAAEAYISAYVENYNINAQILRFPNVVGPRVTHGALYDFIRKLKADPGTLLILGDGKQAKPYIYVKDLINAIMLVFEKSKPGLDVYHVGNDDLATVDYIAQVVIKRMGLSNVTVRYTGSSVGWTGDVARFRYNSAKIEKLGFRARYDSKQSVEIAAQKILERK